MTTNRGRFGRVAVAMGGNSVEREVSLDSGAQVLAALRARGVDATPVDGINALIDAIDAQRVDRVFNIIHGSGGEDGQIQGVLDALDVPYTGSGVLGSAISMDKVVSKELWLHHGLPTSPYRLIDALDDAYEALAAIGLPAVCKPVTGGSSIGVSLVRQENQLEAAMETARGASNAQVMIEPLVGGGEYTVAVLGERTLPAVRIRPAREFYDYEAKYVDDATRYDCPAGLDREQEAWLGEAALAAFGALRLHGWARIDFLRDADGSFVLLEANTTPGMTSHSLVPKAARQVGIEFDELCMNVLETSLECEP